MSGHPSSNRIEELFRKLLAEAEEGGYHLNPDEEFTRELVESLIVNIDRYGYPACPCRLAAGKREDDLDRLLSRIREEGLPEDAYAWYLDLRRYGTFPHSGFGLGIERTVAWITGRRHVRELIPFPRVMNRLYP